MIYHAIPAIALTNFEAMHPRSIGTDIFRNLQLDGNKNLDAGQKSFRTAADHATFWNLRFIGNCRRVLDKTRPIPRRRKTPSRKIIRYGNDH